MGERLRERAWERDGLSCLKIDLAGCCSSLKQRQIRERGGGRKV